MHIKFPADIGQGLMLLSLLAYLGYLFVVFNTFSDRPYRGHGFYVYAIFAVVGLLFGALGIWQRISAYVLASIFALVVMPLASKSELRAKTLSLATLALGLLWLGYLTVVSVLVTGYALGPAIVSVFALVTGTAIWIGVSLF